jgi:hypothetical protein
MTPRTSDKGESLKMLRLFADQALVEHPATREHNSCKAVAWKRLNFRGLWLLRLDSNQQPSG